MKNKNQKIQVLKEELIKYSKQMGILDIEIPEMVFTKKEFDAKDKQVEDILNLRRGETVREKGLDGMCSISRRMIYVRMDAGTPKDIWVKTGKTKTDSNGDVWVYWKRVPYGLREVRKTLIHELVHYRFPRMQHGKRFESRIMDILRGTEYPKEHITSPQVRFR